MHPLTVALSPSEAQWTFQHFSGKTPPQLVHLYNAVLWPFKFKFESSSPSSSLAMARIEGESEIGAFLNQVKRAPSRVRDARRMRRKCSAYSTGFGRS